MEDWKQRTRLLLGEEKSERLRQAHVLVVGVGGVGAYAWEVWEPMPPRCFAVRG